MAGPYVVTLRLRVTPLRDLVLPPLPSKLVKSVLLAHGGPLARLVESRGFKPLRIGVPRREGRPLYQTVEGRQPLVVGAGEPLEAEVAAVLGAGEASEVVSSPVEGVYEVPYSGARVVVEPVEVRVEELRSLSLGEPLGALHLRFATPTLLCNRVLLPGESRAPQMYRLYPSPGLVVAYAFRLWNRCAPPEARVYFRDGWDRDASMLARVAEVFMAELGHSVRPETVVVGRDSKGRLRLARGFRGWVTYYVASKRLARILTRIVALAARLGLGRSRAIGFGELEARWVRPDKPPRSPPRER